MYRTDYIVEDSKDVVIVHDLQNNEVGRVTFEGSEAGETASAFAYLMGHELQGPLFETLKGVIAEFGRQGGMWPTEFDRRNTANDWVSYIVRYVSEGAYDGRGGRYSAERFHDHLKKAAALCLRAQIACLTESLSPRHYDRVKCPGCEGVGEEFGIQCGNCEGRGEVVYSDSI